MLEQRLAQLADMVEPGSRVADIGTDHAYLPIALVKDEKVNFAIASDVAAGPLNNAINDIKMAGLEGKIITRLGSGLETLKPEDKIDTIIIAGMGGKLMRDLLDKPAQENNFYENLILEPNVGEPIVRKWLMDHSYKIEAEKIIEVSGHIYELIKAKWVKDLVNLSTAQIQFGPFLLKEKNNIFIKKWSKQLDFQKNLLSNLQKAKQQDANKIEATKKIIAMIEEILHD
ncbi:tRNA (adenine(22)-N(1))-methyltransferase [Lactobacillus sp. PV034]|uniref:tRNA (adenine(22)-N(1))-methyltransferase n=1 Tax=Lactobacillus sp. PV034 TaxID=2594495 RepID=UPI00223EB0DD|nr:class I SAM-dependent methyltransferase [Lactobacillus sp. PV034]QNQ80389.1 SAM-dependent methyltransferase [Lactobacillus sp. PV034]